jgi:hypothetical protein
MDSKDAQLARKVVRALKHDWALVEDFENQQWAWSNSMESFLNSESSKIPYEYENLILVNGSRMTMKGRRPSRKFVACLEKNDYIENLGESLQTPPIFSKHEALYSDGRKEVFIHRSPHVYFFKPTAKGLALLNVKNE